MNDGLWALSRMAKALFQICSWNSRTSKQEIEAERLVILETKLEMEQLWVMRTNKEWPWEEASSGRLRRRSWEDRGTGRLR